MNSRSALFAMAVLSTVLLSLVVGAAFYAVPIFQTLFEGFEVELPLKTRFVMASYQYWIIFPLIPLFVSVKTYTSGAISSEFSRYAGALSISAFFFACVLIAFTISALYGPIYDLSSHGR